MKHASFPFEPFYNTDSSILILGSFPSVKSREIGFYYGHPQNRFWRVLAEVFNEEVPQSIEEKKQFLKKYKIALWDVIDSCEIEGSSDSSIKNAIPSDLHKIVDVCEIKHIYVNGKKAEQLFDKYFKELIHIKTCLPSTSPANAGYSLEKLKEIWKVIKDGEK